MGEHARIKTGKLTFTAMMAGLSFVLCVFVNFPQMAPFQHFVNVIAAVFLGPWYASLAGIICGFMRMMLAGCDIQAVIGAMFGPICGGLLYKKTNNIWLCGAGEIFGTGIVSAVAVFPFMKYVYGLDVPAYFYIPFYTPSAVMGAAMGVGVIILLDRSGAMKQLKRQIEK